MRRAILQGMGKARGGWSGQGLSPALACGRTRQGKARIEGKGKARIDEVVKKISNKAVKQKPPSGGAGCEASGRRPALQR